VPKHERLDYRHDDGEAKYLENSALETPREGEQIMGATWRRRFG
jgi:hypothetical protein